MPNLNTIVSVERTLRVILFLAEESKPIGVTEVSKNLKIPKAAISRILKTLEDKDFVIQDSETDLFSLGPGILHISKKVYIQDLLLHFSRPHLRTLAEKTMELSNLGIIHNGKVLVLESVNGTKNSKISVQLSPIADLHCSSLGKSLLICKSKDEIEALIGSPPYTVFTKNTISALEELILEVEKVNIGGIAIDNEETEEGLMCVGAPIRDSTGAAVGAISISAPKYRFSDEKLELAEKLILESTNEISERFIG